MTACRECGTGLSPQRLSCPVCHALVHVAELNRLAETAATARDGQDLLGESAAWREALGLLPTGSRQHETISQRVSELSTLIETADPTGATVAESSEGQRSSRWRWAGVGGVVLLAWKLKAVIAFVVTKAKFLLGGLTKATTFFSMFLSLGVYWAAFGWKFALGLVVSIYVHEMGHVAALRRFGIGASAPMFLPGLGAVVRLKQYPVDAREDARVGLAGPLWGLGAAVAAYVIYLATDAPIWGAIARVGAWINLFNLLPVWQLDGGRGFRALSQSQRYVLTLLIGAAWFLTAEGLLVLVLLVAAWRSWSEKDARDANGDMRALVEFCVLVVALSALTLVQVPIGDPTGD